MEHKRRRGVNELTSSPSTTKTIPNELLLEIFVRVRAPRDVVRCTAVCSHWRSLLNVSHSDHFIKRYMDHHKNNHHHTTILFRCSRFQSRALNQLSLGSQQKLDDIWNLDFVPGWPSLAVRASCHDLLLVSRTRKFHYVCNPLTRRYLELPEGHLYNLTGFEDHRHHLSGSYGYGLVKKPDTCSFRAVLISMSMFIPDGTYEFKANVFSSETGEWSMSSFGVPNVYVAENPEYCILYRGIQLGVVLANHGVLFWLEGIHTEFKLIAAFDPYRLTCFSIKLPRSFAHIPRPSNEKLRLGAVQGRLWLSEMSSNVLKIWELNYENNDKKEQYEEEEEEEEDYSWGLVHEIEFNGGNDIVFVLAFDPNDRDVIFLVRNHYVYKCNIEKGEYSKIGKFLPHQPVAEIKQTVSQHLEVFTFANPVWPTLIV